MRFFTDRSATELFVEDFNADGHDDIKGRVLLSACCSTLVCRTIECGPQLYWVDRAFYGDYADFDGDGLIDFLVADSCESLPLFHAGPCLSTRR